MKFALLDPFSIRANKLRFCKESRGSFSFGNGNSTSATAARYEIRRKQFPPLASNLPALNIDLPDIDGDVRSFQLEMGAVFDDSGVARTFGNRDAALAAVSSGAVLVDQSNRGLIRLAGSGARSFLQNQSTNDFSHMQPGQGCNTVFVNATGRCLDLVTALLNDNSALLLVSAEMKDTLLQRFDKYIFPADNVQVRDVSARCATLTLAGPGAEGILREIGGDAVTILDSPPGSHQLLGLRAGAGPVMVVVGSGLHIPGYTLIVDETIAGELYSELINKGCVPMGADEWEVARVLSGRPAAGSELTEEYLPLEAALYDCISLSKGCYIGQETLSKVHNTGALRRQLWGLAVSGPACAGDAITSISGTEVLGSVTSAVQVADGDCAALGYVRCRVAGAQVDVEGIEVLVNGQPARVRAIPYAVRAFAGEKSVAETSAATLDIRAQEAKRLKEEEKAAEAAAKQERLKAMEARLAAWQSQTAGTQKGAS